MRIKRVSFYKQDHVGDPRNLGGGRILLGVNGCKPMLRAGLKAEDIARGDNLVVAIGGRTAEDRLRDRLTWGGIPVAKRPDGKVVFQGFFFGEQGSVDWRERFPSVASFVDGVGRGHRSRSIPDDVRAQFVELFRWALSLKPVAGKVAGAANGKAGRCAAKRVCGSR